MDGVFKVINTSELVVGGKSYTPAIKIQQDTNNQGIYLDNNGTETGIQINQDGVLGADKQALRIYSNTAQVTSPLCEMYIDNASSTLGVLRCDNDGAGRGVYIVQSGALGANNAGLYVHLTNNINGAYGQRIYTDYVHTGGTLLDVRNDAATSAAISIGIINDAAADCLFIDHNLAGNAIEIDSDDNSVNAMYALVMNLTNAGAGLEYAFRFNGSEIVAGAVGGSQDKKIRISIAGTDYFIPCHTT